MQSEGLLLMDSLPIEDYFEFDLYLMALFNDFNFW